MMTYFKLITVIALLLCLAPMPYGYYMLVRIATMIAFGMMAYSYAKGRKEGMAWICIAVILLFQPFLKIPLGRVLWNYVDVVAAIFICCNLWANQKSKK